MSHLRLILHGKAADREPIREAVKQIRAAGHKLEVRVTYEAGDAPRFAKEAAADGVDTVVAGGGDGTLNEVVAGILDGTGPPRCSVGLLPLGTANDFAHGCGIPVDDPTAALRLAAEGEARPIDLGAVTGRAFVNLASGGLGTKITVETPPILKKTLGGVSYLITGASRFDDIEPVEGRFTGPGGFSWEGSFWAMAVGNGRQAGGGISLCPKALLDDGLLDLSILPELPTELRGEKLGLLLKEGLSALEREVVYQQLPWLEVEVPSGLHVNLDGEPIRREKIRFEVREHWLRFHLGPSAPLMGESPGEPSGLLGEGQVRAD